MEKGAPATLYVFKGNYGLPSVDPRCLQVIFLLRLHSKHNIEVKTCGFCTYPKLPYLKHKGRIFESNRSIADQIQKLVEQDCDSAFPPVERGRILAYKEATYNILNDAIDLHFWGLDKNNQSLIKLYGKGKYFPFSVIFARRLNSYTQDIIFDLTEIDSFADKLVKSNRAIENFLSDLSVMLEKNKYILGDKPSSLDAYVCGFLAPVVTLKFPHPMLQDMVKAHKVIVKYIERFVAEYGDKYTGDPPITPNDNSAQENERASVGLIIFASFVAVSTMLCFGVVHDLIKIK